MTIIRHELRQGRTAFLVWTASIASLLAVCVFLFPEMKAETDAVGAMFASMGSFSAAFGMDRLDLGTLTGFYAVECGNILSLGGAFFAALSGISALAREEKDGTAEFLLTHPLTRARVVSGKLAALLGQITAMDLALFALALLCIRLIGEPVPWRELALLHGACCLLHLELGCLCFGVSAFLRRGGTGLGIGLAVMLYFLNLIANVSERAAFLKEMTPFAYCEGADLIAAGRLDARRAAFGLLAACLGAAAAYARYCRKDIR